MKVEFIKRVEANPKKLPSTVKCFVVIRHTHSGDMIEAVSDNKGWATYQAEEIANQAALDYGYGRTTLLNATLTLESE